MKRFAIGLAMALAAGMLRADGDLPDGYAEAASIEVPSGAFVDTGYKPNQDTRVVMDVTVQGETEYWFGCWDRNYNDGAFAFGNDGSGIYAGYGSQGGTFGSVVSNGRYTVELDKNAVKVDGSQKSAFTNESFSLANNLYLFAQNRKGSAFVRGGQASIICHGCTISEGGVTNRVFVPCVRSEDGALGLYDTVGMSDGRGGKFYVLLGSSGLPYLYQKKDSITVPRGAYIDTDYKPNQDTHVTMDVNVQGKWEYWFGVWDEAFNKRVYALGNDGDRGVYFGIGNVGGSYKRESTGGGVLPGRTTVEIDNWVSKFGGAKSVDHQSDREDFQLLNNLYLFAQNRNGTAFAPSNQTSIICHGCTISEGSVTNRVFVPCVRTADGHEGFYDTVGGDFYGLSQDIDPSQDQYCQDYLKRHDFTSETFVEFNRWQEDELVGYLMAASWAMQHAHEDYLKHQEYGRSGPIGVVCDKDYAYINVRLTLRNPQKETWRLGPKVIDCIRKLALGEKNDGKQHTVSLVIEANPDYFPAPQTLYGISITNAFRSLDLVGGPISISTEKQKPIKFAVRGYKDHLRANGYSTSVIYGLTFAGCENLQGYGGAVRGGGSDGDKLHAVRIINCSFSNCRAQYGGAFYVADTDSTLFKDRQLLRFRAFDGSDLLEADFEGVQGSHIYHCTFDGCTSQHAGGAIYGKRAKNGTVITDCIFRNCTADGDTKSPSAGGGAIFEALTAYRCTFASCRASNDKGGGCCRVFNVVSSVFWDCSSKNNGAAIDRANDRNICVAACTLHNCTSTDGKDKDQYAIGTRTKMAGIVNPVVGCLLLNAPPNPSGQVKLNGTLNLTDKTEDGATYFIAPQSDYHLNPDNIRLVEMRETPDASALYVSEGTWPIYIDGADAWGYDSLYDRDGWKLIDKNHLTVSGCYRAYTDLQWKDEQARRRPWEWRTLNPLAVTVAEDVVDPKDGKISFREACLYLERHETAPATVCADQWPKITFALPSGKRAVDVTNGAVTLDDKNRPEFFGAGLTGRQPVIIDGGTEGMTIRNGGSNTNLVNLGVAGVVSNVLFCGGMVSVGANAAPQQGLIQVSVPFTNSMGSVGMKTVIRRVSNDRNMLFDNCAFEGGASEGWLASSIWGNVRFAGCSFQNAADGLARGAVDLNVTPQWISRFECCTFSRMGNVDCVIKFRDEGGELRLANCTFAENAVNRADVMIGTVSNGVDGTFRALNCIFADGADKATTSVIGRTKVYCPLWDSGRYDPVKKGELMVNIATGTPGDVFDSDRITRSIRGVVQYAYKPKHASTARYGRKSFAFDDGKTMSQPAVDIFLQPQTGSYNSMGSLYVDDRETPSIGVTTSEDVTDPYDDVISLREAIDYGGSATDGRFVKGLAVTPAFADGVSPLSVTGAIRIAADTIYRDFALVIGPGERQTLTISSATNSQDGVFAQDAGTKQLQFRRVTFSNCGTVCGAGGVLNTAGRYRFDDCRFDGCWAAGLAEPDYGRILARIEGVRALLGEAGYTDDLGLSQVSQITNATAAVVAAKEAIVEYYSGRGDVNEMLRLVKSALDGVARAIDNACDVLSSASSAILAQAEFRSADMRLEKASGELNGLTSELKGFGASAAAGRGGAVYASKDADGILYNVTACDDFAGGAGGVVANEGNLVGVNLTFCRNTAASGAAVHCAGGTNLFASVAFVDNVSATNGALHASGGAFGIVNSIVIANASRAGGGCDLTADAGVATNVQVHTISGTDAAKADVFANGGEPVRAVVSNGVEHLYYPLDPMGLASGTGAYVFFAGENRKDDSRETGWLRNVFYSTDPDGLNPKAEVLFGSSKNRNTYLMYDLLGNLIESWDKKLQRVLPASMGPVPKLTAAAGPSAVVTTTRDDAGAAAGETTLRAAAEYAMTNGLPVVIADELFSGGRAVFELNRQIDVPKGAVLRIDAGTGRTVELRPAEAKETNRFFNVFGSLSAVGLTLRGGYARSDYGEMSLRPENDADGGAVIGYGPMAFTNCAFLSNRASGHGGAIWSCGGLSIAGCTFVANCADCYGGAVYSDRERLDVCGSTFTDNVAQRGGAIYVLGGTNAIPQIQSTDIERNVAKVSGGGLYLEGGAEDRIVEIQGVDMRIVGNVAGDPSSDVFVGERVKFTESESPVPGENGGEEVEPDPRPEPLVDDFEGGTVTYPKTPKSKGAYQEFLKEKSMAAWTAKPFVGCAFAGWKWVSGTGGAAFNALSENEKRSKTLRIRIAEGEKVRPADVAAVWCRIDEDQIMSVGIDTNGLHVVTRSYVTASVAGLPSGLKFNAKTLAITGAAKARNGDYAVKVSVKNASGYTWKQTFTFTVADKAVTGISAGDPTTSGVPVMLWCDEKKGAVKGAKVYAAGKKATVRATPAKGSVFLGWYADPGYANAATNLPKGYLTASQSVVVPEGGLALYARFAELKPWAVGTFDGVCYDGDTNEFGTVTFTVSSKGKVSGKAMVGGKTYSFSAPMLDDAREVDGVTVFVAHPTAKVNGAQKTMEMVIGEGGVESLGRAEIRGVDGQLAFAVAVQNGWKLKPSSLPAFPTGRKALATDTPDGFSLKFGAKGVVKVAGKVDGANVSTSGQTLPVSWIGDGKTELAAQVCVYVAKKGFCRTYDVVFAVRDGRIEGFAK